MDLASVADELYALPVDEFIPTRNARVKEARSAKDRELAEAIGALRKPSTSAWVVNLLARERPDLVDQLLDLAEALRAAQETLSGPELRALSAQRHRVVASIVGEARKLSATQGVRVSDAIERELEATFDAALADPSAADAVRSGRLESALSYAGLGAAPAGDTVPPRNARPQKAATPKKSAAPKKDDEAERREQERRAEERRQAEEALRNAEKAASEAEAELAEARTTQEQATAAQQEAEQRVADLTAQLEQAQADVSARSTEARERKRAVQRAEQHAQEAQRRVERARSALERAETA